MAGLARILKICGEMTIQSGNESVIWVWDYVNDKAVIKSKTKTIKK